MDGMEERHLRRGKSMARSEEHTSELQSPCNLVCRLLLEKKKKKTTYRSAGPTKIYQGVLALTIRNGGAPRYLLGTGVFLRSARVKRPPPYGPTRRPRSEY